MRSLRPTVRMQPTPSPQAVQLSAWRRLIAYLLAPPAGDVSPTCRPQGVGLSARAPLPPHPNGGGTPSPPGVGAEALPPNEEEQRR